MSFPQSIDGGRRRNIWTDNGDKVQLNEPKNVDFNNQKIINLSEPTLAGDGATKGYVDTAIGGSGATKLIDNLSNTIVDASTGQVDCTNKKILNVLTADTATGVPTKGYVDIGDKTLKSTANAVVLDATSGNTEFTTDILGSDGSSIEVVGVGINYTVSREPILRLNQGQAEANPLKSGQIGFGYNGSNTFQHFISTAHNSSVNSNSIDFHVCNGTSDNALDSSNEPNHVFTMGTPNNICRLPLSMNNNNIVNVNNITAGTLTGNIISSSITGGNSVIINAGDTNSLRIVEDSSRVFLQTPVAHSLQLGADFTDTNATMRFLNQEIDVYGSIDFNSNTISGIKIPTANDQAVNKGYVDSNFAQPNDVLWNSVGGNVQLKTADTVSMQSQKIVDLAEPTLATDGATKKYVDDNIPVPQATLDFGITVFVSSIGVFTLEADDSVNIDSANVNMPTNGNVSFTGVPAFTRTNSLAMATLDSLTSTIISAEIDHVNNWIDLRTSGDLPCRFKLRVSFY